MCPKFFQKISHLMLQLKKAQKFWKKIKKIVPYGAIFKTPKYQQIKNGLMPQFSKCAKN
jgi:hypothetical protein